MTFCGGWTHQSNQEDSVTTLAKLLLKLRVGVVGGGLAKDLDSLFEVSDIPLLTSLFKHSPSFVFGLGGDMLHVDKLCILAFVGIVTYRTNM